MHNLSAQLEQLLTESIAGEWQQQLQPVLLNTRPEFKGEFTLVAFPLAKALKLSPDVLCERLGSILITKAPQLVKEYQVVKGFLNISLKPEAWLQYYNFFSDRDNPVYKPANSTGKHIMVEYSSPNTNKPLHLGHVRNNVLGYAVSELLIARGHRVSRVNLVNDRGIHICKSMLAWKLYGQGETPESSGIKGDHLVGKYYVLFDKEYKKQIQELVNTGHEKTWAEQNAPLMLECQSLLRLWEQNDTATRQLWTRMNTWVYEGFKTTYTQLGVTFDTTYYESETYTLGKSCIDTGLAQGVFYKKENGSIAIDLRAEGLDEKIVLRADGTSVYITQDIGTAIERFKAYPDLSQLIYTVGNEQDYHFKVLFHILNRLGYSWAQHCRHLSYGMVELPDGKMKSREGTVVDADDVINEMFETAKSTTEALGKTEQFNADESEQLYKMLGMGALKYFILKVDAVKTMLFDPKESIDFNGNTGPFIQYTHARICSLLKKSAYSHAHKISETVSLNLEPAELQLLRHFHDLEPLLEDAEKDLNPSKVAHYAYELTKSYNRFYQECPVLKESRTEIRQFRLHVSYQTALVLRSVMRILGITLPQRM